MIGVAPRVGAIIHSRDTVGSTQTALAEFAGAGAPEGTAVIARHQTAGRGRRGRQWWDEPGESLLVSVLLRPRVKTAHVPQLSLVAGLAVAEALERTAGVSPRIRWPNDVLVGGRKISGVLAEASSGADGGVTHVLLGIGINLAQREFPAEIEGRATSLRVLTGRSPDPGRILAALLESMDRRYQRWLVEGFPTLRQEWRDRASTLGERVRMPDGGEGVAVDVAEDGALLVEAGAGVVRRVVSLLAAAEG